MSLARCKREHTSTDLLLWKAYLEELPNDFHWEAHYMARIAQEVRRIYAVLTGDASGLDHQSFMIEFAQREVAVLSEEDQIERTRHYNETSKALWLGAFGITVPE